MDLESWLKENHRDIYQEFKKAEKAEKDSLVLDEDDDTKWDGTWTDDQRRVIDAIASRSDEDKDPAKYITWANWECCPNINLKEDIDCFNRYETISLWDIAARVLPIEDEFCEEAIKKLNLTVGEVNETLLWLAKEANSSAVYDW